MTQPLWTPSPEQQAAAAITDFRLRAQAAAGRPLPDYDALHAWSVQAPADFWRFYADYAELPWRAPPQEIVSGEPMPHTRWFRGAELNYAEALLFPPGVDDPEATAIVAVVEGDPEDAPARRWSYRELRAVVARVRAGLERAGVQPGDRVVAYAANLPETVALLLGCAALGAVFASCSPDFGLDAALARFGQVEPKLLFATPVYRYNGRAFRTDDTVRALAAAMPSLRGVVLLPYPGEPTPELEPAAGGVGEPLACEVRDWNAWLPDEGEPRFASLPFDHPLYVLFSSGTTGLPKAMVHRAGGALLSHHKEQRLHADIRPGDVVFYFTTCGWMMWNWLVSALAQGAAIVLYEGNPAHPDLQRLWRLAGRERVTFFGTSARFLHALDAHDARPADVADLAPLRTVASTGSPLSPAGFRFVYERVKADVHLASISGGTDIVSCFMLGVPTEPVYPGQIQRPGLGVDLAVFDEAGRPVTGEPGELVCRQPLPSMPLRFWNDPDGARYRDAYFDRFPGVWRHGDLVERTPEGGIVVYGRSDATLNPGGVRIGTAEIYRPLEAVDEVVEAIAVGRRGGENGSGGADEVIWLFVVLHEGAALDAELERRIRAAIRSGASPRHVPQRVFRVPELPRTRSGKAMEIAVSRLVNGRPVPNRSVMANPEALDAVAEALREAGVALDAQEAP